MRAVKVAMRRHHSIRWQPSLDLEGVDVLREHAPELAVRVQQGEEVVRGRGREVARPELLAQPLEGLRVVDEKLQTRHGHGLVSLSTTEASTTVSWRILGRAHIDIKDCLWVRQPIRREVVV